MNGEEALLVADGEGEEEEEEASNVIKESSSSASSETGSTSSGDDSSSSSSADSASRGSSLWREDELGEHLLVTCAENEAKLYKDRFARGSIGRCVWFKGRWITPNEFQAISGRQSSKDWKRSIRLNGRCLKEYIGEGLFVEHTKICRCRICQGGDEELRRQEGVLALAAKRRRLSQAGMESVTAAHPHTAHALSQSFSDNDGNGGVALGEEEEESPISDVGQVAAAEEAARRQQKLANSSVRKKKRGRPPKNHRVWSPSGEVAREEEGSSNEEDEYRPNRMPPGLSDIEPIDDEAVIDGSDYLPRKYGRAMRQKLTGYRTELGTYTTKPSEWDSEEVAEFLRLQGFASYADAFQEYDINGQTLFLLKEHHLLEKFNMKLGPTLRLLDTIGRLQHPPAIF